MQIHILQSIVLHFSNKINTKWYEEAIDKYKITNGTSHLLKPHKKYFIAPLLFDGADIGRTLPLLFHFI